MLLGGCGCGGGTTAPTAGAVLYDSQTAPALTDIMVLLRQYRLEPKRIRFVQPYADKEPTMVLVEAARGGKPMVKVDAPLVIYQAPQEYTEEIVEIYYGKGQA